MKRNNPLYLRDTLLQSHALQARYNKLDAASTQNIRNPIPMRDLVVSVLPVLPNPNAMVKVKTTSTYRFNGQTFTKHKTSFVHARDIIPLDSWKKSGKSVQEVMDDLKAQGFIVNSRASVATALSQARMNGEIESVYQSSNLPKGTWPHSLYFVTE